MARDPYGRLSRRERQILDILFELGEATAEQVRAKLPDPPSYSAARAMLAKLETKGSVRHVERDLRYVYLPSVSRSAARSSAVSRLVKVFFGGSLGRAVTGMVDVAGERLSDEDLDRIEQAIRSQRKRRGKRSKS
jgi:predicted transcriptional regulator